MSANAAAHDAITRLLHRMEPSTEQLWQEAQPQVQLNQGVLVIDDSTLDKWYAAKMELVTRHWSGKHGRVVQGINLITLLWTQGDRHIPLDYRFYERCVDGATKNDHFRSMLATAKERGFAPRCVVFDGWYSGLDNLKLIRGCGWIWLTRLKRNRQVNPDNTDNRPRFVRSQLPRLAQSYTSKAMVSSKSSRLSPQTVTLITGRPTTSSWVNCNGCNLPSSPGRLRSIIEDSNSAVEPNVLKFVRAVPSAITSVCQFAPSSASNCIGSLRALVVMKQSWQLCAMPFVPT
jgi:hypothetical protein